MSKSKKVSVSIVDHPACLPVYDIADGVDHECIAKTFVQSLGTLSHLSVANNVIWRDSLAMTGTFRTFFGPNTIIQVWNELSSKHKATDFSFKCNSSRIVRMNEGHNWIEAEFCFLTDGKHPASCSGLIGLTPSSTGWKIWLLCTILERPKAWPDVDDLRPITSGATENEFKIEKLSQHHDCEVPNVGCIVVGGGMSGLCMAGRLQALDVSYHVIEQKERIGMTWLRERYDSIRLHTPKEYNQLPGLPRTFKTGDAYHLDASTIARRFQEYVTTFGIRVMVSTCLVAARWLEQDSKWEVKLQDTSTGQVRKIRTKHLVMACGSTGIIPNMPAVKDQDSFRGLVLHERDWRIKPGWRGKSGIVIGSANTAQWVINDMAASSFKSITMVQRARTHLLPTKILSGLLDPIYNSEVPTSISDRAMFAYPLSIQRLIAMSRIRHLASQNTEYYDRLTAQGYDGERNSDLWGLMYDREGGHFFDLGAGELIAKGIVQVRSKVEVEAFTATGLQLSDGSKLDADIIVFATGYCSSLKSSTIDIVGSEIGDSLEEFWQCDREGEIRGAWKHIGHPGIWYTGHGYAHARYYSRFVAMQIKADLDGQPMDTYNDTPELVVLSSHL